MKLTREDRLVIANKFIKIISDHGRRFFYYDKENRVGYLKIKDGLVYYVSEYSGNEINFSQSLHNIARKFSHGSTLRALMIALRKYIQGKGKLPINHLGPWNKNIVDDGDLWGYGKEEMEKVRKECRELQEVKHV